MWSDAEEIDVTGDTSHRRSVQSGSFIAIVLAALSIVLAACGTPAASAKTPGNASSATSIAASCQGVTAALSDGPDPSADPVGYAEAQILPLRQIKISDTSLHKAIDALANAYETVYKTNDKKGTEAAVNTAGKIIDKICPGVF